MIRIPTSALLLVCGIALGAISAKAEQHSVLVELFTSEGCSSCPPAHAVLARLSEQPDVLALSFHVDYWDYIGWEDRFAAPWATDRQRRYAKRLSKGSVYTPQMVISGRRQDVGSLSRRVMHHVKAETNTPSVSLLLVQDETGHVAVLGPSSVPGEIYFVRFDRRQESNIRAGENRGRKLPTFNVVRTYRKVADWDGKAGRIPLGKWTAGEHPGEIAAVIVQRTEQGGLIACATAD